LIQAKIDFASCFCLFQNGLLAIHTRKSALVVCNKPILFLITMKCFLEVAARFSDLFLSFFRFKMCT